MIDPRPFSAREIVALAKRAIEKIDRDGSRGTTNCSIEEIEALALLAATSPLIQTEEGETP